MIIKKRFALPLTALILGLALALGSISVTAAPSGETTSSIQSLSTDLETLKNQLQEITTELEGLKAETEQAQINLASAKLYEEQQLQAMEARAKIVYETGDFGYFELLMNSQSISHFLANAEYVNSVTTYDKEILDNCKNARELVETRQQEVDVKQEHLTQAQADLTTQIADLESQLESASTELQGVIGEAKKASDPVQVPGDELILFAALLEAESGQNYDGNLAVGTVVMNRVAHPSYANSITEVIFQSGQFSPTWNGALNRILEKGPAGVCLQAANDLAAGIRHSAVINCYSFNCVGSGAVGINIGGNIFY
ncbi:outer membrane murein-binding lipoprotein Lpp [Lachnospiraceae bacterium PF1-21]|uniref:Cell wall hydrolase n=1 Tax=Ohessyouella blattaphilus TaxID=2949333 RepID=A0ABT1EIU6_9FIRM|nr:cell wall hydrolase [Ohessyouella blattaphilus]MCP1110625.1 cell wall hydrolase [Ohessyouella blattaphilus]MCR8564019.1 cell wall hydrolase [Ohessyouella blattaphilus]